MPPRQLPPPGVPEVEAGPEGGGKPSGASGADGALDLAARAILGHLRELADCRALCERMGPSVGVLHEPNCLRLVAALEYTPQGDPSLVRAALEGLKSAGRWRGGRPWEAGGTEPARPPMARHVVWEGGPALAAVLDRGWGLVRLEVLLPEGPLPALPEQQAAAGLRLVEHLAERGGLRCVPLSELPDPTPPSVTEHLKRAKQQNPASSQCNRPGGAATCLSPECSPLAHDPKPQTEEGPPALLGGLLPQVDRDRGPAGPLPGRPGRHDPGALRRAAGR